MADDQMLERVAEAIRAATAKPHHRLDPARAAIEAMRGEPAAWKYVENRTPSGRSVDRVRISEKRQVLSPDDVAELQITEEPLYALPAHPAAIKD